MNVLIYPSRFILEDDFLGSKNLTHLYLIASFIANQGIILENVSKCDDINATLSFFKEIGKEVVFNEEYSCYIKPSTLKPLKNISIHVGSSTSTLLYLLPLSLQVAEKVVFTCDDDLISLALKLYEEVSNFCNVSIKAVQNQLICSGNLNLDYYEIDGSYSSQYILGFILNALYLKRPITIQIKPPFNCQKNILMSIDILKQFGFDISFDEYNIYIHTYSIPTWDYFKIEGDYSVLANYLVLACLNGSLIAHHFNEFSLQSEKQIVDILQKCGGNVKYLKKDDETCLYALNNTLLEKGFSKLLKPFQIDLYECCDIALSLMVLACFTNGVSTFNNYHLLKYKEKWRVEKLIDLLLRLNVNLKVNEQSFTIKGQKDYYNQVILPSYNDYKIVMSLSVFALLNHGYIEITQVECINKSDPLFFKKLMKGCKLGSIQIN